jgi:putative ABC transport system ATP-binding protein
VNPDQSIVRIEELTKHYLAGAASVHALKGISLQIQQGEMVALIGPSGSGKTTLLNLLGCLDRPSSGSYWLEREDVSQLDDQRLSQIRNEKIGFVFQTFNLLPRLSAVDNVKLPLLYSHQRLSEQAPWQALEKVGLTDRAHHRPNQLSGGQQQRVAIARALVMEPAILLADEPTGNLDTRSGEEVLLVFQQLNLQGVTLLIITHDARVARHAKRVVEMRDGKIIADYPVTDRLLAEQVLPTLPEPEVERA